VLYFKKIPEINDVFNLIVSKRFQSILFFSTLALLAWSFVGRRVHVDDGWLAEYTFYLYKLGYVKSEALRGWLTVDSQLFFYHKLWAYMGSVWGSLFGFGAYASKALSLVFSGLAGIMIWLIYQKISIVKSNAFLCLAMFFSFHHAVELSFTYRPEMAVTFFALVCFYLIICHLETGSRSTLILAGLAGGAAIATHLNGVVVVGAGVFLFWSLKRFWSGFFLGLIGVWGLLFYFVDVKSISDLLIFSQQFRNARDLSGEHFEWYRYFLNILNEQKRFLHSLPEILYSLVILISLYSSRKMYQGKKMYVLVFAGYITLFLAVIAHGKTAKYLLYASPFFILWTVLALEQLSIGSKARRILMGAFVIYVGGSWLYDINFFRKKETALIELQQVSSVIPDGARVLANTNYFFISQGKQLVQTYVNYDDELKIGKLQPTANSFFERATEFDIEYVLLDEAQRKRFNIFDDHYGCFSRMDNNSTGEIWLYRCSK